tara:strand:+ start:8599 stop:9549 length:951 start_codon:yes stop_codon:yes gene_type:complete
MLTNLSKKKLEQQGYKFTGDHSTTKICHWTKNDLTKGSPCYKNKFYNIQSNQCAQMTPNMFCSNLCDFCWRDIPTGNNIKMNKIDNPDEIIENTIKEQLKTISGFGGNNNLDKEKFKQAQTIKHFAISLTGEPTLYPKLGELINKLHKRKISSFLVTNGQYPEAIEKLEKTNSLPTQIYLSLDAPTKELYFDIDKPTLKDFWERFTKTINLFNKIKNRTRTVLRITAVKNRNMCNEKDYAELIKKADPKFLEIKGFVLLGPSIEKLTFENVPSHKEIKEFANKISENCDYKIVDEQKISKVVLLIKEETKDRFLNC